MTREQKTFAFEVKSTDDAQGTIEGYLSVFNVVDQGKDRVVKGAFKRTIANSKKRAADNKNAYIFPMLWQHRDDSPIGGVIDAKEDDHGLFTVAQFDLDTQRGREAYSGYKKGYLNQLSIGYDVVRKSYDAKGVRDLEEIRLWEQSTVTFAMNEEALVTAVKSATALLDEDEPSQPWQEAKGGGMSAAKRDTIAAHIDTLHALADVHKAASARHTKALHSIADDLATMLQGSAAAYGTDPGTSETGNEGTSKARPPREAPGTGSSSPADTDLDTALAQLLTLRTPNTTTTR